MYLCISGARVNCFRSTDLKLILRDSILMKTIRPLSSSILDLAESLEADGLSDLAES